MGFYGNKLIVLAALSIIFPLLSNAQVSVSIHSNVVEGCAPLEVSFSADVQNCTGTISYSWNFGFSGGNSSLPSPSTLFQNPGTYNVILNVSCTEGNASDNLQIIVRQPPTAAIANSPVTGCRPLVVNFIDGSTPGDGDINYWEWFFNDGTPLSNQQNPPHTYNFPGIFNVLLNVRDEYGCTSTATATGLVAVSDTPSVAFTAFPLSYCQPPLNVTFQSIVSTNFNLPFQAFWTFGDGNNASGATAQNNYTSANIYDVSLTVIDDYGCTNSVTYNDYINITELVPDYSMYIGSTPVAAGSTICTNTTIHFMNLTSQPCKWDFGNGQSSLLNIVNYTFNQPGTYNILFTVQPDGDCENSVSFQLFVEDVSASFTTNPQSLFSCNTPFDVTFTNTSSSNATGFNYTFGDGESSSLPNPVHTYNSNGTFPVVLTVTTNNGCSEQFSTQVVITSPDASFTADEGEGCAPLAEVFTYTGTSGGSITNYHWDFADGTVITDGNDTESHVFANEGEYDVVLTVTDNNNCVASSTVTVNVGTPIPGSLTFQLFDDVLNDWFDVTGTVFCAQDTFRIVNPLFDNELIDDFEWQLDSIDEDSQEEFTYWAFDQDTGFVSVMFVTNYNGCRDTLHLDSIFYINGPVIQSINRIYDCENPFDYVFSVDIINDEDDLTLNWDWFIKQGQTASVLLHQELNSTNEQLSYTFPGTGVYWVKVLARSSETGCDFVDSMMINVSLPIASFVASDNDFCAGTTIYFDASASSSDVTYHWDFGDGSTQDYSDNPVTSHQFNDYGDFTVVLTVQDVNGCTSQDSIQIHSSGPVVSIITNPDPAHGCNSLTVDFSFDLISDFPLNYNVWQISSIPQSFYSLTVQRTFGPGTYDVTLTVSTTNNCSATVTVPGIVVVSSIEAAISTLDPVECTNTPVQFYAGIENPELNYSWEFGDGGTSNLINPTHIYTNDGIYTATLQVDDGLGCVDNDEIQIEVQGVDVNFSIAQTIFDCYPAFLDITNHTDPDLYSPYWLWTFNNGDTLPVFEPQDYFISAPGVYWVKLLAYTSHGCESSDSVQVTVNGPVFNYYYSPQTICVGDEVHFEVTDMNSDYDVRWYIRGQQFLGTEVDYVFTEMPPEGYTEAQLLVSEGGCEVPISLPVYIQQVVSAFGIIDSLGAPVNSSCSPFDFDLINQTAGADTIIWTIGGVVYPGSDTLSLSISNPFHVDSLIQIQCFGQNELGCVDSITQTITVFATPNLQISNDTLICLGDQISVYVSGANSVVWSPDLHISDINSLTPIVSPEQNAVYTAVITDINTCTATDSVFIAVQQVPEIDVTPAYDTIMVGDSIWVTTLSNQDGVNFVWTPQYEISCLNCPEPYLTPKESTRYTVTVEDSAGCFRHNYYVDIYVIESYTLDVPSAFTPLGAESNRVVYANGFGIKRLIEFRIFNRWGEEVFFTDDLNIGWDGYHKGELQNIDTYKYFVRAEMWNGEIYERKGDILLMR